MFESSADFVAKNSNAAIPPFKNGTTTTPTRMKADPVAPAAVLDADEAAELESAVN